MHKAGQPVQLRCEYTETPLGIDTPAPRFSWAIDDTLRGTVQKAYQVIVSSSMAKLSQNKGDIWNSKKVVSDQSQFVLYQGIPLESSQRYYWKVRIWKNAGRVSKWSEPHWFETAFLKPSDWQASWIVASHGKDVCPPRSVMVRKEFQLNEVPAQARLYVTGLGNYVFYLNGQRVGDDLLTPGWTNYRQKVQYQIYDVSKLLQKGANAAGAILGNMWWSSGMNANFYSHGPLCLLVQLQITYPDGKKTLVLSDSTWKFTFSPVVENHIYNGETYDARLEFPGWNKPGFNDNTWGNTSFADTLNKRLVAQQGPPIQIEKELKPVSITEPKTGIYVFDMGQNMAGIARIHIKAEKGTEIVLRFAELLHDDGTVAQENLRSAKATDRYICSGSGEEVWQPMFTYHGFRYVEVSGLREKPDTNTLTGLVFHSSAPFRGMFSCSDTLLNTIWKNITWGQRSNMMSVPTDCPQRDERLGWMGDAQIFSSTASYNMNMDQFYTKWLRDIADCQDPSGYVNDVSPAFVVSGPAKPGWGDAVVIVPYETYRFCGDRRILQEQYQTMKKWVTYMYNKSKDNLYEFGDKDWGGYGDWVAVVPSPTKPTGGLYYYHSTQLLSKIAGILGKKRDSTELESRLPLIAEAYQKKYYRPDSGCYIWNTQTMNLLPVAFGITPKEMKAEIIKKVADDVVRRDTHLTTGFMGTAYLLPLLCDYGYDDIAYRVATQTTYPSWGYMVKKGATTMWELWNSDTERPDQMNSRNHFAYGSVGAWYYGYIVGIQPLIDQPGFRKTLIAPYVGGQLAEASAELLTGYGKLAVQWNKKEGGIKLHIQIPANTSSIVRIPVPSKKDYTITENGHDVFKSGNAGTMTKALKFVRLTDRFAEFETGSGIYNFEVQ